MSGLEKSENQSMEDLHKAGALRQEAEFLEQKARVRARLKQLLELSKDPYYNRYLAQMMKDLENGKATPEQVDREAQRSYNKYRQRMAQMEQPHPALALAGQDVLHSGLAGKKQEVKDNRTKRSAEFKIGVYAFSIVGAIFVLISFVIFGFNFLTGAMQGLCLYGAALILIIVSELVLQKRMRTFACVATGIGIGGLYAANMVNSLVLRILPGGVNGVFTMGITLLTALGGMLAGKKRDSMAIRLTSLVGCCLCFLPINQGETELNFLIAFIAVPAVNISSIFIQNESRQTVLNSVHLLLNVIFTVFTVSFFWRRETTAYLMLFVVTSFLFADMLGLKKCKGKNTVLYLFDCAANGIYIFLLFLIGNFAPGVFGEPDMALFAHLTALALIVPACCVVFLLWDKDDGRRWAQMYFAVCTILLLGSFSKYHLEIILSVLAAFLITKLKSGQREIVALDCIVTFWTGIAGFFLAEHWYCWLFAGALILSALMIKGMHLYHETVITMSILLIWCKQCLHCFYEKQGFDFGWFYPVSAGILLLLFLLFNHLPWLKNKNQKFYNAINIIFMVLYYLGVWTCGNYVVSSVMMALGTVTIIIVFRERYGMAISKKYLLLAGFLTYFTLTGHYESPVIVSILLMMTALLSVGVGFRVYDKAERVYGLVMAVIVCLKLVMYDFREVGMMYRVIVFLVVGLIALIISFIYIQLEKKITEK